MMDSPNMMTACRTIRSTGSTSRSPVCGFGKLRLATEPTCETGHILLQGVPPALSSATLARDLERIPGVQNIHHLHV